MPNTYTQLHIQFVFAVKYRHALIQNEWKEELHKYITGLVQQNEHKMLQINSMPDHIHILTGMRPLQSISSFVQHIKTEKEKELTHHSSYDHTIRRCAWLCIIIFYIVSIMCLLPTLT